MGRMTLREAAARTDRSVTTLRRYIRTGKLRARLQTGRFGPEYLVEEDDLREAGLPPSTDESHSVAPPRDVPATARATERRDRGMLARDSVIERGVPIALFEELQMKHEQLLVQYGMMRASGMRVLETQAELDLKNRKLTELEREITILRQRLRTESAHLTKKLQEAELELEGRALEIAALREKVRGLERLQRHEGSDEPVSTQFERVLAQARRVEGRFSERSSASKHPSTGIDGLGWKPRERDEDA